MVIGKIIALIISVLMLNLAYLTIRLIKQRTCKHYFVYVRKCVKCGKEQKGVTENPKQEVKK